MTTDESPSDAAYAFHRSLGGLNRFLQVFALYRGDDWIRPISTRELRPIVIIGSLSLDDNWECLSLMLMHPEGKERTLSSRPVEVISKDSIGR